jgi:hypothetical protein
LLLRINNGKFTKKPIEFRTNQKEVYQQEARVCLMYFDLRLIMSHHLRMFDGHTMFTTFLWATTDSTATICLKLSPRREESGPPTVQARTWFRRSAVRTVPPEKSWCLKEMILNDFRHI